MKGLWKVESVANLGNVGDAKLALDSAGKPHISYHDIVNDVSNLVYIHKVGLNWVSETVDSAGDVGWHNSIRVDSAGNPHIAYHDQTNQKVKYAYKDGSGWHLQNVGYGWSPSLALDSSDNPHISFQDTDSSHPDNGLLYAKWNGSSWDIQVVDNSNGWMTGWWCWLDLDSNGNPHISYFDSVDEYLRHASWNGSSWDTEIVDNSGTTCYYSSIQVDGAGKPHIIYFWYHDTNQEIRHAVWNGSSWDIETVDVYCWPDPSSELDNSGNPQVGYVGANYQWALTCYARWKGSSWEIKNVDSKQTVQVMGVALTSSGNPRILRKTMDDYGNLFLEYASYLTIPSFRTSLQVKNYGIGAVHILYQLEITEPDGTVTSKTLNQYLAMGKSVSLYLGQYPVKTTIRVKEYIYNKLLFSGPIHIMNLFTVGRIGSYTQNIHQKNMKPSPIKNKNPVYAEKEILITRKGLKVKIITPPGKK